MNSRFTPPSSKEDFSALVSDIEAGAGYGRPAAFALGLATVENGKVIAVTYTITNYESSYGTAAVLAASLGLEEKGLQTGEYLLTPVQVDSALNLFRPFIGEAGHGNIETLTRIKTRAEGEGWKRSLQEAAVPVNALVPVLGVVRAWDDDPRTCADACLRLYAVSQGFKKSSEVDVAVIKKVLPLVVQSDQLGIFSVEEWNTRKEEFVYSGYSAALRVVYQFPRLIDHVVSISMIKADPDQLRLGDTIDE